MNRVIVGGHDLKLSGRVSVIGPSKGLGGPSRGEEDVKRVL